MPDNRPKIDDINDSTGLVGLGPIPSEAPVASFNLDQIENLIKTKGIVAYHYKHAPNPDRRSVEVGTNVNTQGAQRGVVYYQAREIRVVPQSFKLEHQLQVQGLYDVQSVLLNVSGNYYDGDQEHVYMRPRDLVVLNPTITVMVDQFVEYNPNGPLKANYKIKDVDLLMTSKRKFEKDKDFKVMDGKVYWIQGGARPDFHNGKGDILTIVYWATPIYVVQSLPHVFRVLPDNEIGHGALPRRARYAPQLVIASQSHLREEKDLLDFSELPDYATYADSKNTTGGS